MGKNLGDKGCSTDAEAERACTAIIDGLNWRSSLAPAADPHEVMRDRLEQLKKQSAERNHHRWWGKTSGGGEGLLTRGSKAVSCTGEDAVVFICMWVMGMSAFPITETLLLQTSMFTRCFQWPGFYGVATVLLFLPGLLVQMLQNRYDKQIDTRFGARVTSSVRLVLGHTVQLLALAGFLVGLFSRGGNEGTELDVLLVVSFVVIGLGCSTVYGTSAQLISIFPAKFHPAFFIGTYSVSVILAPYNAALGELYEPANAMGGAGSAAAAATAANASHGLDSGIDDGLTPTMHNQCYVMWPKVTSFYIAGGLFNICGLVAFSVLSCLTRAGSDALFDKNQTLQSESSQELEAHINAVNTDNDFMASERIDSGNGRISMHDASDAPEDSLERTQNGPSVSLLSIWLRCSGVGATMALALTENLLVVSQYESLTPVGGSLPSSWPGIGTVMIYSFYAAQAAGAMTVMLPAVQRCLAPRALLGLALLRVPGIFVIFEYNDTDPGTVKAGKGLFGSDWQLFWFYFVFLLRQIYYYTSHTH